LTQNFQKYKRTFLCLLLGSFIQISYSQTGWLQNNGFELSSAGIYTTSNAVSGWTVLSQINNTTCTTNTNNVWVQGSPEFSVLTTPVINDPNIGPLSHSPLGGSKIVRLNNSTANNLTTKIVQTISVTSTNNTLFFAFAGYWANDGGAHNCCEKAKPYVQVKDCSGNILISQPINLLLPCPGNQPSGINSYTTNGNIFGCNWQVNWLSLYPYIGSCVTVEFLNSDCNGGGHVGSMYLDVMEYSPLFNYWSIMSPPYMSVSFAASSGGNNIGQNTVFYCPGTLSTSIDASYLLNNSQSFNWTAPSGYSLSSSQATSMPLSISNPTSGSIFTLTINGGLVSTSQITFTLLSQQMSPLALATSSACSPSAGGSATLVPNISGLTYNYVWTNTANVVVGTQSVLTNMSPGLYTINYSAPSASNCSAGSASVQIGLKHLTVTPMPTLFCKNQSAYLTAPSGTAFQWYNGTLAIVGGTSNTLTIPNALNNSIYNLGFTTANGCRDSLKYTLLETQPGNLAINFYNSICQNSTTGVGYISVNFSPYFLYNTPLNGTVNYQINSTNSNYPYSSTVNNSTPYFSLSGMPASTFSLHVFDGFCLYDTLFSNQSYVMNYSISPGTSTVCSNSPIQFSAAVSISPNIATSYTWTSNSTLFSGSNSASVVFTPSVSAGSSLSIIFTLQIKPNNFNCPETKTVELIVHNLISPSITAIPNLCISAPSLSVTANPPGGGFNTNYPYIIPPISNTGILTPSNSLLGQNTITYAYQIATCSASTMANYLITGPVLNVTPSDTICMGETISLVAYGANSYTWNTGAQNDTILIAPFFNSTYQVSTNDSVGCINTKSIYVIVRECVSIQELESNSEIKVFPTFFKSDFYILTDSDIELYILDNIGKLIYRKRFEAGKQLINFSEFNSGIYVCKILKENKVIAIKMVKE